MHLIKTLSTKHWFRITTPLLLLAVWLGIGGIGGPTFGKLSQVANNNQASFLPASADSTKVQNQQNAFLKTKGIPAVVVITSQRKITAQTLPTYREVATELKNTRGVSGASNAVIGPIVSKDKVAAEYIVQLENSGHAQKYVNLLQHTVDRHKPTGAKSYVTGPAGLLAALTSAFSGIDGILLYVTMGAVLVILLLVYRSVLLPFVVLVGAALALSGAGLTVYHGVQLGWFKLNGQSQGILSILVIGAATDYSLLITARYREALEWHKDRWGAMMVALKSAATPIIASGATVILALLCLLFSDLNSNKDLGPIAAIGIVFALLSALTFLPTMLVLLGRIAFWPFKPKFNPSLHQTVITTGLEDRKGVWSKVAVFVSGHARAIWLLCFVILAACAINLVNFKASGVSETDTILGKSSAVSGQNVLSQHFSAGSGSPVLIITDANKANSVLTKTQHMPGINDASLVYVHPLSSASPTHGISRQPRVVSGKVMIEATLETPADSPRSETFVRNLRQALNTIDPHTIVGGTTAILIDTNNTAKADLHKIIPIVLLVIFIVLILILRSLVAPAILILSVILSFAATIGISAFVFNRIFHFAGSDASIPLFGFIFLVALGVDYNIFLMTRVREESLKIGTRPGILRGLSVTGSVITSAGAVLAATFAALSVVPVLFLVQMAFIVAFGVLLDTIVVRSLLVPAVTYDIGRFIWWPSHRDKS